ncbi:MAG TPA: transketolase C-terminal domain-containing protein [Candidatus Elarobacter sp.]|nr:transketolase C-terminal domain-containing protein [Dongiaceae bacterium]HZW54596.1 transketolase C-terminal domain-containing protein [Candidatus Elarobacter sp.]
MRATFTRTLTEIAQADPRVLLLTADLGFMALEPFADAHPDRFLNVGVAEQNMIGLATGLADGGFIPFLYSIAPFASLRPYEFLRNGPIQHRLPVRVVGVGAGFEYGTAGPSHHGIDDAAALRPHPGLLIVTPAEPAQLRTALLATWDHDGPVYYRIGKDERVAVPGLQGRFRTGRAEIVREGRDVALVAMGALATEACAAADLLGQRGLSASVAIVSTFNPSPVEDITALARAHPLLVSVEAQYVNGGLGSLVAETVAEDGAGTRLVRVGVRRAPQGRSGSQAYYHALHELDAGAIAARVLALLAGERV